MTNPASYLGQIGWSGYGYDAAGQVYQVHARSYDPQSERFLQQDPLGIGAGDANFYRYVGNSPVNYTDPSGEEEAADNALAGAIGLGQTQFADGQEVITMAPTSRMLRPAPMLVAPTWNNSYEWGTPGWLMNSRELNSPGMSLGTLGGYWSQPGETRLEGTLFSTLGTSNASRAAYVQNNAPVLERAVGAFGSLGMSSMVSFANFACGYIDTLTFSIAKLLRNMNDLSHPDYNSAEYAFGRDMAANLALPGCSNFSRILSVAQLLGNVQSLEYNVNQGNYLGAFFSGVGILGNISSMFSACFTTGTRVMVPIWDCERYGDPSFDLPHDVHGGLSPDCSCTNPRRFA